MRPVSRLRLQLLWLFLLASPAVCAAPEAILHAGLGATVDGAAAIDGMRIFAGQTLATPPGRFSDLILRGTSLRILGNTQLRFNGDSAELISGAVLLTTSNRFSISSGCAQATPPADTSRYLIQLKGKIVFVTAQQSEVIVKSQKTRRVSPGKTVAVYCAAPAQDIVGLGSEAGAKIAMGVSSAATVAAGTLPLVSSQPQSSMSPPSPSEP
jgi:hypothetical protein